MTDSSGVRRKVRRNLNERKLWGKHQDAWKKVWQHRCKMHSAHLVKAHLGEEEAEARARTKGYPPQWNALNKAADELARIGMTQHAEDPGNDALGRWRKKQVMMYWRYLLDVYNLVRSRSTSGKEWIAGTDRERRAGKPATQRTHGIALAETTRAHALCRNQCMPHMRAHNVQRETTSHASAMAGPVRDVLFPAVRYSDRGAEAQNSKIQWLGCAISVDTQAWILAMHTVRRCDA